MRKQSNAPQFICMQCNLNEQNGKWFEQFNCTALNFVVSLFPGISRFHQDLKFYFKQQFTNFNVSIKLLKHF